MIWKAAVLISLLAVASPCWSEECTSVIALSLLQNKIISSKSEVESSAYWFCSEYSRNQGSSNSSSFGASYHFLAATFASGSASVDDVASKYCSAQNNYAASVNAYNSYIETIAPGAYQAYEQCIAAKKTMLFDINEGSVLPKQFAMSVAFTQPGPASATLQASPSDGVTCAWNGLAAGAGNLPKVSIHSPSSATLLCHRQDASNKAFVTIAHTNGSESITIPWKAYTPEGVAVDLVDSLKRNVSTAEDQIKNIKAKVQGFDVQAGILELNAVNTRSIKDQSQCLNGPGAARGDINGHFTFSRPFTVPPVVSVGLTQLDAANNANLRIALAVSGITKQGFNYTFNTWCNTAIFSAVANWMAVAKF